MVSLDLIKDLRDCELLVLLLLNVSILWLLVFLNSVVNTLLLEALTVDG